MPYASAASSRKFSIAQSTLAALSLGCSLPLWALEAPSKVQVPTLAYDDQQIILVWEKPAGHADISDYHVYANGQLLGSSNANNDQVSPATSTTASPSTASPPTVSNPIPNTASACDQWGATARSQATARWLCNVPPPCRRCSM